MKQDDKKAAPLSKDSQSEYVFRLHDVYKNINSQVARRLEVIAEKLNEVNVNIRNGVGLPVEEEPPIDEINEKVSCPECGSTDLFEYSQTDNELDEIYAGWKCGECGIIF